MVQFLEKRRRKGYFFQKGDEEVCWEQWTIDVTLAKPRTESGESASACQERQSYAEGPTDMTKVQSAMERSLQKAAMKVVTTAVDERDHIPPITVKDANPFPYQILINPKEHAWSRGIGIF